MKEPEQFNIDQLFDCIQQKVKAVFPQFAELHGEIAIACGSQILYHENFSYADAPFRVAKNSQYLIGSVTKQFTAAALLKSLYDRQSTLSGQNDTKTLKKLVENDLQRPVSFFLPEENQIWNGNMPKWANGVTIHHLLTHTSGIRKINEIAFDDSFEGACGQQFLYSNPNYVLIGEIISELANTTLDNYFKKVLFDLAGMENTYLPLNGTPKDLKRQKNFNNLALGFEYHLIPHDVTFSLADEKITFEELNVAGGMVSTVEDCIKWNNALYQGKIIPVSVVELMLTKYIPAIPFPTYYGLDRIWYGYGIEIYHEGQKICYQHAGGCPGYQARLIYLPTSKVSIVHLSNSQKDNTNYINEKNNILKKYHCNDITAEEIFDKQYPDYKSRIQNRIAIFSFANELRDLIL